MLRQITGLIISFLLFKVTDVYGLQTKTCSGKPANIVFVLDSSSSIWIVDYKKQLDFVGKLVSTFDIGPGRTQVRVGAITFSNSAHLEFSLDKHKNLKSLSKAISNIPYRTGLTNTAAALLLLRRDLETRIQTSTAPFIAIIITDGFSMDSQATRHQAKLLHNLGVVVYAIGVGNNYHLKELKYIASDPKENVFQVSGYSALKGIAQTLNVKTCKDIEITTATMTSTTLRTTRLATTANETPTTTTPILTTTTPQTTTIKSTTRIYPVPFTTNPWREQRDKASSVSFGYDLLSMGAYRSHMISQFINSLLPYTGYGHFSVVTYSFCPESFNIPVTSLMNSTHKEFNFSVPTENGIPDLSDVVYKIRKDLHSSLVQEELSDFQTVVLFLDPAITIVTPRLLHETKRLKRQGSRLFLINVGQRPWHHLRHMHTMSSQPSYNYILNFPTYHHLLHSVKYAPFGLGGLCHNYGSFY